MLFLPWGSATLTSTYHSLGAIERVFGTIPYETGKPLHLFNFGGETEVVRGKWDQDDARSNLMEA